LLGVHENACGDEEKKACENFLHKGNLLILGDETILLREKASIIIGEANRPSKLGNLANYRSLRCKG
jgi:hypothetical protein